MALKGLNPNRTYTYIPKDQRDGPEPAKFFFKPLSPAVLAQIEDKEMIVQPDENKQVKTMSMGTKMGTRTLLTLRNALVGWENVLYEDDSDKWVPAVFQMDGNVASDETIAVIPPRYRDELEEAILDMNTLEEEDAKNS